MAIVASEYRKTKAEVNSVLDSVRNDRDVDVKLLLTIDYAYHNTDKNYEDGLSFLDRLHSKLSKYYPLQWNINNLKNTIRSSNDPSCAFLDCLNEILTDDMIVCYGV